MKRRSRGAIRNMRLAAATLAAVVACAGMVRPMPALAAAADARECPRASLIWPTGARHFQAVFSSKAAQRSSFSVTLYSKTLAYDVAFDGVDIGGDTAEAQGLLRSAAFSFTMPDDTRLLAASVRAVPDGASDCTATHLLIPSVDDVKHPTLAAPQLLGPLDDLGATKATSTALVAKRRRTFVAPACAQPFTNARVLRASQPVYPEISREQGAVGQTTMNVWIEADGRVRRIAIAQSSGSQALDMAGVAAAHTSTYAPATFLCEAERGFTRFIADFPGT